MIEEDTYRIDVLILIPGSLSPQQPMNGMTLNGNDVAS